MTPRQPGKEAWDGPVCGLEGATRIFGADDAQTNEPSSILHHLQQALSTCEHVYVDLPQ